MNESNSQLEIEIDKIIDDEINSMKRVLERKGSHNLFKDHRYKHIINKLLYISRKHYV